MMVTFSHKVICIVFLLGISVIVGCSTMSSSGSASSGKTGIFPWSKPKEEKKVTSVNDFIARERPNIAHR